MPTPRPEFWRRRWRGLAALALLAIAPKCLLCLAVWLGLGAMLGLGGPELCGAPSGSIGAETAASYAGAALALLGIGFAGWRARGRTRDPSQVVPPVSR